MVLKACDHVRHAGRHFRVTDAMADMVERDYGWRKLGTGQNGMCIEHPYDYNLVVKVITNTSDGGMDVASWIWRHQEKGMRSEHLPHVLAITVDMANNRAAVVMEKLDSSSAVSPAVREQHMPQWIMGTSDDPVLQKFFHDMGSPDDLHSGNWMSRNGQPVLIDPLYQRARNRDERWDEFWLDGKMHVEVQRRRAPKGMPAWIHPDVRKTYMEAERMVAFQHIDGRRAMVPRGGRNEDMIHIEPFTAIWHVFPDRHRGIDERRHRMERHDIGVVFGRHEFRAIPQQIKKRSPDRLRPMFGFDFAQIEKRVAGQFADMMVVDDLMLKPNMVHAMDGKMLEQQMREMQRMMERNNIPPAPRKVRSERPELVKDGSPAAIRREKEDRMLRIRTQHDNQPHRAGLQRTLLPGQQPRRVSTPWAAKFDRVESSARGQCDPTGRAVGPPIGLHNRYPGTPPYMAAPLKRFG